MDWATIGQAVLSGGLQAVGSYLQGNAQEKASKKAYKRALEFAQNGIQWKVADANAAGINPYFALGAPTASFSDPGIGVDPLGSALESMGQNVSRAALANASPGDKMTAAMQPLLLEKAGLENDYLRAKIATETRLATQAGTGPGINNLPIAEKLIPVTDPGLGQQAENDYSDIGGNVYGGLAMLRDFMKATGGQPALDTSKREFDAITSFLDKTQRQGYLDLRPVFDYFGWRY